MSEELWGDYVLLIGVYGNEMCRRLAAGQWKRPHGSADHSLRRMTFLALINSHLRRERLPSPLWKFRASAAAVSRYAPESPRRKLRIPSSLACPDQRGP